MEIRKQMIDAVQQQLNLIKMINSITIRNTKPHQVISYRYMQGQDAVAPQVQGEYVVVEIWVVMLTTNIPRKMSITIDDQLEMNLSIIN